MFSWGICASIRTTINSVKIDNNLIYSLRASPDLKKLYSYLLADFDKKASMSRTHKHSRQRELKSRLEKRKLELGDKLSGMALTIDTCSDPEIRKIVSEFYRGSLRHGNKRHYEAYMKWKRRKVSRYKISHVIDYLEEVSYKTHPQK